jgi:predicted methyltransferase
MTTPEPSVAIRAALDHPDRPAEDRARDADRRPAQVLEFFGVSPGMKVAELMTGRGYYAEILARVVGKTGVVYAHNSPFVVARFADQPLAERLARPGLEHVVRLDRELEQPGLPSNLDIVLIILFYHDTYWQNVDRTAMNRAVYAALAPGGIYGVIDHHAKPGSADRDVKTLHRVDADLVKREILAAGFEFIADSDVLHDPDDARTINVFDQSIRGRTDRFIFKFRKPAHAPPNHSP